MKRWVSLCSALFLLALPAAAGSSPSDGGLPGLQQDLAAIIERLLACHESETELRFIESALGVAEIRTHPLFELDWGKHPGNAKVERELLLGAARSLARFNAGDCPGARKSLRELLQLAQKFIQANDRSRRADRGTALELNPSCGIGPLRESLAASQLLLKYVLLEDRVLVFYFGANQAGYQFLPFGRSQVAAMVQQLVDPLEAFADGKVDYLRIHFDMGLAQRLYNVLLKKVVERFPQADELIIIPDGELFKLPFEALVSGFDDHFPNNDALFSEYEAAEYVIQEFNVSYFFSLADFLRSFRAPLKYAYDLAAFGNPLITALPAGSPSSPADGNPAIASAFTAIPSTRQEVLDLEKLFSGKRRRIFLGAEFNLENFFRFAPQARLVHLATHFFNDQKDPQRSAFLFSAAGREPPFCDARKILDLRLQAELVILSACETSERNLLGFKLVSGMTAAFRRSGVRGLIASLWPVDEISSQLVPLFYRRYLGARTVPRHCAAPNWPCSAKPSPSAMTSSCPWPIRFCGPTTFSTASVAERPQAGRSSPSMRAVQAAFPLAGCLPKLRRDGRPAALPGCEGRYGTEIRDALTAGRLDGSRETSYTFRMQPTAIIPQLPETRHFQGVAAVLAARGWAEASGGNMSLRLEPAAGRSAPAPGRILEAVVDMTDLIGDRFLVTASGSRMRHLAGDPAGCLCLVQVLDRHRLWLVDGAGPLTGEWPTHAGLHSLFKESRSSERAVLHCHPLSLIALSHVFDSEKEMNDRLFRMHHETRLFIPEMLGLIPYSVTGSIALAKASREKLKKHRLALWDKHGVIASGSTMDQALDRVEMVEKAAALFLLLRGAGLEPEGLSDEQVQATLSATKK